MSLTGPRTPMMSSLIPPRTLSLNAVNEVWMVLKLFYALTICKGIRSMAEVLGNVSWNQYWYPSGGKCTFPISHHSLNIYPLFDSIQLSISSFHLPEEEANLADSDSDVNMSHQFTSAGSKASKDVGRRIGNSQHRMRTHLMGFPLYFVSRVLEGTILENQTDIHTIIASYYVTPCQRKAEQEAARPENMVCNLWLSAFNESYNFFTG